MWEYSVQFIHLIHVLFQFINIEAAGLNVQTSNFEFDFCYCCLYRLRLTSVRIVRYILVF